MAHRLISFSLALVVLTMTMAFTATAQDYTVVEQDDEIQISTPQLAAAIRKQGYVTGVKAQSFVDKKTGAKDLGFGLDIADWIMEPGSDEAYRGRRYVVGNSRPGRRIRSSGHPRARRRLGSTRSR